MNLSTRYPSTVQDQATEVILTLGEAFEVAYQMALKEHFGNNRAGTHSRSHSSASANALTNSSQKCITRDSEKCHSDLAKYFIRNNDGHTPLTLLIAEKKFDEIRKLFGIENADDVKLFKHLILCVGNRTFREKYQIEKDVADEVFSRVINELSNLSENFSQLSKYYRSSFSSRIDNFKCNEVSLQNGNGSTSGVEKYFVRDSSKLIPLWVMMVEERYDEIRQAFNVESLNDTEVLKKIATDMGNKIFRNTYHIEKDVADEVFECAADELMAREGSMAQLLEHYNSSYNN